MHSGVVPRIDPFARVRDSVRVSGVNLGVGVEDLGFRVSLRFRFSLCLQGRIRVLEPEKQKQPGMWRVDVRELEVFRFRR